jgi:hypothetical protein
VRVFLLQAHKASAPRRMPRNDSAVAAGARLSLRAIGDCRNGDGTISGLPCAYQSRHRQDKTLGKLQNKSRST